METTRTMTTQAPSHNPGSLDRLILIDERNRALGSAEKHAAHRSGFLHRAFSIFLFDDAGRLLLQRRAAGKYHSGGLWANTCCGHPRPHEPTGRAAARRLREELGLATALTFTFHARYRAALDHGMIENELVYVFAGRLPAGPIRPDPMEADAIDFSTLDELKEQMRVSPRRYTVWLRHYLRQHEDQLRCMADGLYWPQHRPALVSNHDLRA
jgi:isopentenyl-diphosphate delta-isomerase